jgi:hypothetical protein
MIGPVVFLEIEGVVVHWEYVKQRDKARGDSRFDPGSVKQLYRSSGRLSAASSCPQPGV